VTPENSRECDRVSVNDRFINERFVARATCGVLYSTRWHYFWSRAVLRLSEVKSTRHRPTGDGLENIKSEADCDPRGWQSRKRKKHRQRSRSEPRIPYWNEFLYGYWMRNSKCAMHFLDILLWKVESFRILSAGFFREPFLPHFCLHSTDHLSQNRNQDRDSQEYLILSS